MAIGVRRFPLRGLRVSDRAVNLARAASVVFLVLAVAMVMLLARSDLLQPADIGTDASNYFAAGQRVAAAGEVYELAAGDRPVPADNPPLWTVPLLSPPTIAVGWAAPAAFLPAGGVIYGWWVLGLLGSLSTAAVATRTRSVAGLLALTALAPATAITAVSGNLNALLLPAYLLTFVLTRSASTPRVNAALAIVVGTAAAWKLGPVMLLWWLLIQGRGRAAVGAVLVGALWALVTVAAAGPEIVGTYVDISGRTALVGASSISATGIALSLGVPPSVAPFAPMLSVVLAGLAAVLTRRRPSVSFAIIVLGTIYATPVVRSESFALLVAAVAASAVSHADWRVGPTQLGRGGLVLAAVAMTVIALGAVAAPRSSVLLENRTSEVIIVRFGVTAQGNASFGYSVPPGAVVRGYTRLVGGLTGFVAVFGPGCNELAREEAPHAGGMISFAPPGVIRVEPERGDPAPLAAYVDDCAGD